MTRPLNREQCLTDSGAIVGGLHPKKVDIICLATDRVEGQPAALIRILPNDGSTVARHATITLAIFARPSRLFYFLHRQAL